MNELPQERLIVALHAVAMMERALALTIDYVKQRKAFGKKIIEFQNTQFELAECKTEATVAGCSSTIASSATSPASSTPSPPRWPSTGSPTCREKSSTAACNCSAAMAIWTSIRSRACTAMRACMRIYAGTNEIMKLVIARSL